MFGLWLSFLVVHTAFSDGGGTPLFWNIDKVKHLAYFAGGAFALTLSQARPRGWVVVGVMILVGAGHELWQSMIPHRHADGFDLFADTLGAALGYFAARKTVA